MSKKKSTLRDFILVFSSFIIGGLVMFLLIKITNPNSQIITKDGTKIYDKSSLSSSVDKIYDATVAVQGYTGGTATTTGAGFIYKVDDKYGYILTNEHVISSSGAIKVTMTNDEEAEVEVLGKDEYADLAVLKVDKKYVKMIANIGSSEKMNIGDTIFAIGTPASYSYRGSVTAGIVSGKDRLISVPVSDKNTTNWVMNVIQIDASINPGNSGGPVVNVNGEVIGIVSMKITKDNIEGMAFAIPIEYAMNHVETLEEGKKIEWPYVGIKMANTTDTSTLKNNDIKIDNNKEGIVVLSTVEDSPAAKELQKGDIIIKINDKKVSNLAYFKYELYKYKANDTIEVTYLRNGKEKTSKIKLGKME